MMSDVQKLQAALDAVMAVADNLQRAADASRRAAKTAEPVWGVQYNTQATMADLAAKAIRNAINIDHEEQR